MAYVGLAQPTIKPATGTGIKVGKAVSIDIEPQYAEASLFGDNTKAEYEKSFKSAKVTVGTTSLPVAAHTAMFGHAVDTTKNTVTYKSTDSSGYIGFGIYTEEVVDGVHTFAAMWMPKVKFSDPKDSFETKGDSINYKTPSIEGEALADDNMVWKIVQVFDTEAAAQAFLNEKAGITAPEA